MKMNDCKELIKWGSDESVVEDRFVGDMELYIECVDMFVQENDIEKLKKFVEERKVKEAFEQAHAIKGVAGNLGLIPIFDEIVPLVELLRAEKTTNVDEMFEKVEKKYKEFLEIIK